MTAVLGPNGSGKTTLLRALAGLAPMEAGEIMLHPADGGDGGGGPGIEQPDARIWAQDGRELAPAERGVGLVLAEHLLFPHLSLLDNVAFGLRSRGVGRRPAGDRAQRELERVGLGDLADRRPGQVSTGQAQRAALARALATDPVALLLDEPLSALDPQTRSQTRADLARRLTAYDGVTVLVTHDALDALTLADELVFLENGRVTQTGPPEQVMAGPRSAYAAQMVGLNLARGTARVGRDVVVSLPDGAEVVTAEDPVAVTEGAALWCAVAPEAVALYDEAPHGSPRNLWPVTVTEVTLTGQRARVGLAGPLPLTAEVTASSVAGLQIVAGRRLFAGVKATEVRVYPA